MDIGGSAAAASAGRRDDGGESRCDSGAITESVRLCTDRFISVSRASRTASETSAAVRKRVVTVSSKSCAMTETMSGVAAGTSVPYGVVTGVLRSRARWAG